MFPVHQISMIIGFILVVGSSNWKSGKFIITIVQTSYSPTDDSYLSLRYLSVISVTRIVLTQQILFYIKNMFIYVCLYLFVPFVILLYYSLLFTYAHHGISWWSGKSNFFNLEFRNCSVMLFHNFYDVIPFSYCHQFTIF